MYGQWPTLKLVAPFVLPQKYVKNFVINGHNSVIFAPRSLKGATNLRVGHWPYMSSEWSYSQNWLVFWYMASFGGYMKRSKGFLPPMILTLLLGGGGSICRSRYFQFFENPVSQLWYLTETWSFCEDLPQNPCISQLIPTPNHPITLQFPPFFEFFWHNSSLGLYRDLGFLCGWNLWLSW